MAARKTGLWFVFFAALFASCGAPFYYERAQIDEGFSVAVGTGAGTGERISGSRGGIGMAYPVFDAYAAGIGSLALRYAPNERSAVFLQADGGFGRWLTHRAGDSSVMVTGAVQFGAKLRTGSHGAIRLALGAPSLADIVYLHDLTDFLSLNAGLGFRGVGLGIGLHPRISERLLGHVTLNGVRGISYRYRSGMSGDVGPFYSSVALGFGLEVVPARPPVHGTRSKQ